MLGRGKQNDIFLYEITEQDLLVGGESVAAYSVGNVLMYADKKTVTLGAELARADDLDAAKEYLKQKDKYGAGSHKDRRLDQAYSEMYSQIAEKEESLKALTKKIEQRDELLKDIAETLKSQREENELLHLQLKKAREQLAVDELIRNELFDDLQNVSKDTHTIESTLEHVMEEKYSLEQELAEKITNLVELDLQNDELRRLLENTALSNDTKANRIDAEYAPNPASINAESKITSVKASAQPSQILTMASGKEIHVMHEFSKPHKTGFLSNSKHIMSSALKIFGTAVIAMALIATISIITTAATNGISQGEALDMMLERFGLPTLSLILA